MYSKELQNSPLLKKSVLKLLQFPSVVLVCFSVIFISYSYSTFIKGRKKEFGLFMNLGMSIWDVRKLIFVENSLIAAASILLGVASGTIFARLFFLIITRLIGIVDVSFHIAGESYIYSIAIFTGIFFLAVLTTIITTGRYEIVNLLKSDRKAETNSRANPTLAVTGIVIFIGSLIILYIWFDGTGMLLLQSTIGFMLGLYITISQLGAVILKLLKKRKNSYYNNLLFMTNFNYKFKQTKKIIFILATMTAVVIFINGFYLSAFLSAEKMALQNNPFDIAFVQMPSKNNVQNDIIDKVIAESKNIVEDHKILEFAIVHNDIIVSQEQLKLATNTDLNVNKGSYIRLIQGDDFSENEKSDIYKAENKYPPISVRGIFINQEYKFKMLFNGPAYLFSRCIILNNDDFKSLKNNNSSLEIGKLQLYNFKDWKKTQQLVNNLEETFKASVGNRVGEQYTIRNEEEYNRGYLEVSSKIGTYNDHRQGAKMLFYLLTSIGIFFFIAISIVLFLQLFSELDNEKLKYKKLYKIGITEEEIRKSIGREFIALFFAGPLIGIPIAILYTLIFSKSTTSYKFEYIVCDLIISAIFLAFELIYYFITKNSYSNEIIESLYD
jgi:hypothetical protein